MPSPFQSAKLRTKASYQTRPFQSRVAGVVAVVHAAAGCAYGAAEAADVARADGTDAVAPTD